MNARRFEHVKMAFEREPLRINITDIQPLRIVSERVKQSVKYEQISASIREVGLVEPLIVARDRSNGRKYLLLDGHLRLEVLKVRGDAEVECLVSTDDEAFTYNKRISRLAIVQEHRMILKAIERGVSEERIARALNVNFQHVRSKRRLLDGICPEVAELLRDRHVPMHTFRELRKMHPVRQIEAAQLMIAMHKFSLGYAKSLVAATPQPQLAEKYQPKVINGLTDDEVALMERESASLEREFKIAEQTYSADHLDLVLAKGYLGRLLGNARIVQYLAQHHRENLAEFQRISEPEAHAA
jgi:hypothetical protein